MSNAHVPVLYKEVMDAVLAKVSAHFTDTGVEEGVLFELSQLWENKLHHSDVARFGGGGSQSSTATSSRQPSVGPSRGFNGVRMLLSAAATSSINASIRPSTTLPQTDGLFDSHPSPIASQSSDSTTSSTSTNNHSDPLKWSISPHSSRSEIDHDLVRRLTQVDGSDAPDPSSAAASQQEKFQEDDNLDSDLDDEDNDLVDETENLVLCQYEKVTRVKNKWKCILKDGIIHANGKDYVFSKANGDFEW